jgi:penicillin-binding protein 2
MQNFRNRLVIVTVILGIAFLVLTSRLWYLQVLKGDEFEKFSLDNRIRIERVPAPRGRILDRFGRELVVNRPSFDVYALPDEIQEVEGLSVSLSEVLGLEPSVIEEKLISAKKISRFMPVLLAKDINRDQLAYIEARKSTLPGLIVEVNNLRKYPRGKLGASFLGYIGKVSKDELKKNPKINSNDLVGKSGIEKNWQSYLRGEDGFIQNVTDALGRGVDSTLFVKDLTNKKSVSGNDVILTVDIDLQSAAEEALGEEAGSIVALDVNTGEVLALASNPTFNPEDFIKGIDSKTWTELINDKSYPLLNRSTQGVYAPGSVFKIVPVVAGLREGVVDPDTLVNCPGHYKLGRNTFRCWKRDGHGWVNLRLAVVQSCDVYFYKLAEKLGIDRFSEYMKLFGFGSPTGIGIEERAGISPSREWKLKKFNKPWYRGETVVSAIGQGYVGTTPIQIAVMTAAVANGGAILKPNIVRKIKTREGETLVQNSAQVVGTIPLKDDMIAFLQDALIGVVNDPGGTGRRARIEGYTVAGKTGTAQVVSLDYQSDQKIHKDHAWFISYAPAEAPEIAVIVLIEHGGKGGAVAAPLAKQIIEIYKKLKETRDLNDNV